MAAFFVRATISAMVLLSPSNLLIDCVCVCLLPPPEASTPLPRKILLVHGALTMVLPYIHTRVRRHALSKAWPDAPSSDRRRKAWELMTKLETTHAAAALASFAVFLWDGQ
jgi:hypothetical protein